MKRVGILTSGGDCQALNATMRGVGKGLYNELGSDVEIYGFEEGYKGLIYNEYRLLTARDFSGNQTIIMITHNMELAKAADRTIMIEDGKIR